MPFHAVGLLCSAPFSDSESATFDLQVKDLDATKIASVDPGVISQLSVEQIKAFTPQQLGAMSTTQLEAFTAEQIAALPPEV